MPSPASTRSVVARCLRVAVLLVVPLLFPNAAEAQPFTDHASGNWTNTDGTWSLLGLIPGLADTANVTTYTITVSDAEMIGVLNLSGGSITGAGGLTIVGSGSTWTGGNLNGLTALTVGGAGDLQLSSGGNLDLDGGSLANNGSLSWTSGTLRVGNGGSVTNGGTLSDSAAGLVTNAWGGAATFLNGTGGTYNKTAGQTDIQIAFVNQGSVYVSGGTLNLHSGGTFGAGSTLDGSGGTLQTLGGVYAASGSVFVIGFIFNGGEITGSPTFSGTMTWLNGDFNSSGTTVVTIPLESTLTIGSGNNHDFYDSSIVNNCIVNWTGGPIRSGSGGSLTNNGTWNDSASSTIVNAWGGGFTFTNAPGANYNVLSGTTNIAIPFVNSGTVTVSSGAAFNLNDGATLNGGSALDGTGGPIQLAAGNFAANGILGISNVTFTGGEITGTPTFSGTMDWSNGDMDSAGTTSITFDSSSTLTISSGNNHDFYESALINNGQVHWTSGPLRTGNGGSFTNNGTFTDAASNAFINAWGGAATFTNSPAGTYVKSAAGETNMGFTFVNSGAVDVQTGTLNFQTGGSTAPAGQITTSSGAVTEFSGGTFTMASGSGLGGPGEYELSGGTLSVGGTASVSSMVQTGGELAGTMQFNATNFEWSNGDWNTVGTVTFDPASTLTIDTGNNHDFKGAAIVNAGTVDWISGPLRTGSNGSVTNTGTWNDSATNSINNAWGGAATFTNLGGVYDKTGGTTDIEIPFVNSGTVNVTGGTLNLDSGATLNGGSSLNGTGGPIQFTGGTFAANGIVTVSNVNLTGGEISGVATFSGTLNWSNGDMNSANTTSITFDPLSSLAISTGNNHDFYESALINNGQVHWTGGPLRTGNGGSFTNNGTFNDVASSAFINAWGGTATFTNSPAGTYLKSAAGATGMDFTFANSGAVDVQSGTLNFQAGGSNTSLGRISTSAGAVTEFSSGTFTLANGSGLSGSGEYELTGGTLSVAGTASVSSMVQAGGELSGTMIFGTTNYEWSNGDWNTVGTVTFDSASTLTIDTGNNHDFLTAAIVNAGTVNWDGGPLRTGNGGSFTNNGIFNDSASSVVNNPWGGAAGFTNGTGATYNKLAAGVTSMQVPFTNSGRVDVQAGTLSFGSGGSNASAGSMTTASGALTEFSGGTFSLANGSLLGGTGQYELSGGTLAIAGTATLDSILQAGGELSGTMTFSATNFEWSNGDWNAAGTVTFDPASSLTIDTGNNHDFNGATVINNGRVNWTGGPLRTGGGGSFTNNAVFNDSASNSVSNPWGGAAEFTNAPTGIYTHTGAGTTTFSNVPFANSGIMSITAGAVDFTGGFTNTGGTLALSGGSAGFPATADFTSGSVLGNGAITATTVTVGGVVAPGATSGVGLLTVNGGLTLLSSSILNFNIGGTAPGTQFDQVAVTGAVALNGDLNISFTNGFQNSVTPAEMFLIVSSSSLSGSFLNVANGSELMTANGFGMFTVNYGPSSLFGVDNVVLSNFTPVPEPTTLALLAGGAAALCGAYIRRRLALRNGSR